MSWPKGRHRYWYERVVLKYILFYRDTSLQKRVAFVLLKKGYMGLLATSYEKLEIELLIFTLLIDTCLGQKGGTVIGKKGWC